MLTCYNCGEPGHISTNCQKPKKAQSGGKVFAMFASLSVESQTIVAGLPMVCEFPKAFQDYIFDLPPERGEVCY